MEENVLKQCNTCKEYKTAEHFYKSKIRNGLAYTCKECHRIKVKGYKHIPDSYAWKYRRYERVRNSAKKRGLEFTLTLEQYWEIKNSPTCYYCKLESDDITIDRRDNSIGYVYENIVPACYDCNKLKSNEYNEEEMRLIGEAIRLKKMRLKNTLP